MHRTIVAAAMAALSMAACEFVGASLERVPLDGDWDFTFKAAGAADTPELPSAPQYDVKVVVPDYLGFQVDRLKTAAWWNFPPSADEAFQLLCGIGFFRKTVLAPDVWKGRSVRLYVGRAYDRINVWINGQHAAFYPYSGMTPLELEISGYLKLGATNEIVLAVDNTQAMEKQYWRYGGIVEPVRLLVAGGPACIKSVYVNPGADLKEAVFQVELEALDPAQISGKTGMEWRIRDASSRALLGQGTVPVNPEHLQRPLSWSVRQDDFRPWHPNAPQLYLVDLSWQDGDVTIDRLEQRFGLRRWSSEGRALKLNGQPIYLRQYYGTSDITHARHPQDKAWWLCFFRLIKARGYNSFDAYNVAMSGEWLAAADEAGIVVQCSATDHVTVEQTTGRKIAQMPDLWTDVIRWTRTYPSMCIYYLGGEINYYDGFIDDCAKIYQLMRALHPEALLLPNQAMRGIEYSFSAEDKKEKLTEKPFPYHAERLRQITAVSDIFGTAKKHFSYVKLDVPWQTVDSWLTIYQRPLIAHEIVMCGRSTPFLWGDQFNSLRYGPQGIEYLCRTYGYPRSKKAVLDRIADNDPKTAVAYENVSRLNAVMCKYVFEKIRKCGNLAGFQDLSGQAGLNLFLDDSPGYTAGAMLRYNDDNVVLLDFDGGNCRNRCYWMGDEFNGRVMVSLYDGAPAPSGNLSWELKDGSQTLKQGSTQAVAIAAGSVTSLAEIVFNWPKLPENKRLNLAVSFRGYDRPAAQTNDWDFWVFRRLAPADVKAKCSPALGRTWAREFPLWTQTDTNRTDRLWVVDLLNEEAIAHLEQGGDVFLTGGRPFPLYTQWPSFQQGHRLWHNCGTIVHAHPIWSQIPHAGWGDWQFYPLLQGAAPVIFAARWQKDWGNQPDTDPRLPIMAEIPFTPILEVLDTLQSRDQAGIFELRVGQGRLMVSTCVADPDKPVCAVLFASIVNYMAGPEFNPGKSVSPDALRRLLPGTWPTVENNALRFSAQVFSGGTLWKKYSVFNIKPRDGIAVNPGDEMKAVFDLQDDQIPTASGGHLTLAIDGQDCDKPGPTGLQILLNGQLVYAGTNRCVKKGWSIWKLPVRREIIRAGQNILVFRNTEDPANSERWFMMAEAIISGKGAGAPAPAASKPSVPVEWHNKPFALAWQAKRWCRVDAGAWKETKKVAFDQPGRWRITVKQRREDAEAETREVGLDLTPPSLKLLSRPPVEQIAGEYFASPATEFALESQDGLSGVKQVETAINSKEYKPYAGPFSLPAGRHSIRARVTDNAGNQTVTFTGGLEGGGATDCIQLQVH